ncbi:unnamed protein product [Absidia cylindrospora]
MTCRNYLATAINDVILESQSKQAIWLMIYKYLPMKTMENGKEYRFVGYTIGDPFSPSIL